MSRVLTTDIEYFEEDIFANHNELYEDPITRNIVKKINEGRYFSHTIFDEIWEYDEDYMDQKCDLLITLLGAKDSDVVELDMSQVIEGGWVEIDKISEFYNQELSKTIVITEGKTDIKVLEKSLDYLYPEYSHLYSFFDFETYRADGGASYLVKLLKSLSAAKIENRVIAVFDNDSAAVNELNQLEKVDLLKNIKRMKLPELDFCRLYPTIGPSGLSNMNINGIAVGIEMFFGDDIFKSNGEYYPIIWNGYIKQIGKYQGAVDKKDYIIKQMIKKLNNPNEEQDWTALRLLWEEIFAIQY